MEDKSLKHYGVLGMKWGIRKYQNPDGSLTAAGKKRYGENGHYEYKSHSTKRYEKKVAKIEKKFEKNAANDKQNKFDKEYNTRKLAQKHALALTNLEASKIVDKRLEDYARNISTGKAILHKVLMGGIGSQLYDTSMAMGNTKLYSLMFGQTRREARQQAYLENYKKIDKDVRNTHNDYVRKVNSNQ